jgi:hypothetical protein
MLPMEFRFAFVALGWKRRKPVPDESGTGFRTNYNERLLTALALVLIVSVQLALQFRILLRVRIQQIAQV